MENNETNGQRLKRLRKEKGLTQDQLAELVGLNARAIKAYEQDYRNLGGAAADTVCDLADVLGVSVKQLLGREN